MRRLFSTGGRGWRVSGFTLIEMLIVVVLIGILVGILLPALYKSKYQAKKRQAQVASRALKTAILDYRLQNRVWPVDDPGGAERDYSADNNVIIEKLINTKPPLDTSTFRRDPITGSALDPWGDPYNIRLDKDYDGFFKGDKSKPIPDGVQVWSTRLGMGTGG